MEHRQGHLTDSERVAAAVRTGLLGGSGDEVLDRLARIAVRSMRTPLAIISVLTCEQHHVISQSGSDEIAHAVLPISESLCRHVVDLGRAYASADIRQDETLAPTPALDDLGVVSYLGVPLADWEGVHVGALCVMDRRRRDWDTDELATMLDLAVLVSERLEARQVAERGGREALDRLQAIVDASPEAIIGKTLDGTITHWSRGAERMYGYSAQEVIGRPITILAANPEQQSEFEEIHEQIARGGDVAPHRTTRRRRDGTVIPVLVTAAPIVDGAGRVIGVSTAAADLSELAEAERAQRDHERRFQAAFENAPIGMALTKIRGRDRGRFVQTNAALNKMLGREPGELDGVRSTSVTHPSDRKLTGEGFRDLATGRTTRLEKRYLHRDGREVWALVHSTAIPNESGGEPELCVTQVLDITERKRFEGQLRYLADHDSLTALFNRHRFNVELERVLAEAHRYKRHGALLVIDLDGFKAINDRFGHAVGDELVKQVSGTLRSCVRETDLVARLGGDEFAIILHEAGENDAVEVATKILGAIQRRGVTPDQEYRARVTASIGITTFDADCELIADELLVEADIAMYDAKAMGRNRHHVYDRQTNRRAIISKRQTWLARLQDAVELGAFELHAQPIVAVHGDGAPRFELLLRLPDGHGDLIPPGTFLYNAERFGLMGAIDRWVLSQAIAVLHDHQAAGHDISLAVNLSGRTMNDLDLPHDLYTMLSDHPIKPGRLVIEVTETAAIVNIERARRLAGDLRGLGCQVALDDFGAGFASFYYLKHLDFDYLKIDGEFIRALPDTPSDQLVVRAIVDISRGLGTQTIAEFVGDDATLALLHDLGVDYAQGYFLGRPGPLHERLPNAGPVSSP